MRKIFLLVLFLSCLCGAAIGQTYYPPYAITAQNPSAQLVFVGTDASGNLYTNGTGSSGAPTVVSGYIPPVAMTGQNPSGVQVYLKTDANGNLYVNCTTGCSGGGGGGLTGLTAGDIPEATAATTAAAPSPGLDIGRTNANGLTFGGSAGVFAKSYNSTDTVNNGAVKFGTGSGGDSTCPAAVSGTSYLCTNAHIISATLNGAAYSPILTSSTLPLVINFTFNSGVTATDATPRILAAHAATIASCYVLTTASDGSTALTINIFDNGTTIFTGGAQTVSAATTPGTLTTLGGLATTSISNNDKISVNITSGTSNWIFSVQCK